MFAVEPHLFVCVFVSVSCTRSLFWTGVPSGSWPWPWVRNSAVPHIRRGPSGERAPTARLPTTTRRLGSYPSFAPFSLACTPRVLLPSPTACVGSGSCKAVGVAGSIETALRTKTRSSLPSAGLLRLFHHRDPCLLSLLARLPPSYSGSPPSLLCPSIILLFPSSAHHPPSSEPQPQP
jgi:hypothetical protein